jgi:molybdopterin adenylyltransferase
MHPIKIGIVNVSDRASAGVYAPEPGRIAQKLIETWLQGPLECLLRVVPDEQTRIEAVLRELADQEGCAWILTTGGTGPALRDITPEATQAVCSRLLPGFGEAMRQESLKEVPTAILSRQTAGIRNQCLILNLPGKPAAIETCLRAVFPAIPYCIELIGGPRLNVNPEAPTPFRPLKS